MMNNRMTIFLIMMVVGLLKMQFAAAEPLRVMSFNIRYGTAKDGANHWDKRRELLIETIKAFHPDLLGTQETLAFQKNYIAEKCSEYTPFGVGRNSGTDDGEMTAIFFRTSRFEKLDGGHFWLSETPDRPGSKSWDSSLPRMVSWVKLKDRQSSGEPVLYFFNTHFDHIGDVARRESAKLIRKKITAIAGAAPAILTGDFNAGESSRPYQELFGPADSKDGKLVTLIDAFRAAHPESTKEEGSFHGFDPTSRSGARIDWIGITNGLRVQSVEIDHTSKDGKAPSDHFPMNAVLEFRRTSAG